MPDKKPPEVPMEFAGWIDDPDEPDRMTDAEIKRMVDGLAKLAPDLGKKPAEDKK